MNTNTENKDVATHQGYQLKVGTIKLGIHNYDVLLNKLQNEYDAAFHRGNDKLAIKKLAMMRRITGEKKKLEQDLFQLYADIKKNTGLADITHLVKFVGEDEDGDAE